AGDGEDRLLGMVAVAEDAFNDVSNGSGFVQGAVNVVDQDGAGERASGELVVLHVCSIHEETSGAAVQENCNSLYALGIHGFYFDV
ncbi:hypothetical protein H0H92_001581, partial [Tricholoma furcatifolium]